MAAHYLLQPDPLESERADGKKRSQTQIEVIGLSDYPLCGDPRPGHFVGCLYRSYQIV